MIEISFQDDIAIITINNPPVNAMSPGVPSGIIAAVKDCNQRPDIKAMVLTGSGKGNIAGADIRFQGKDWPSNEANLRDLIVVLESSAKPMVAALGANTLGGGLELAMACAARVISVSGKVGQPEVNLGIPPGAGGTQRLPRLAGVENAISMIVSGKPVSAQTALAFGVVEQIAADDVVSGAAAYAQSIAANPPTPVRLKNVPDFSAEVFAAARVEAKKKYRGLTAPLVCIDCIEAATTMPIDAGLQYERSRFEELVVSDQAAALRHIFFAERQAGKLNLSTGVDAIPVERIAVIGAGTMGCGISIALLKAGYQVMLIEMSTEALETGANRILAALDRDLSHGRLSKTGHKTATAALAKSGSLDAAGDAQLVIEAVFENMDVKLDIFSSLGRVAPGAILATNTSYLDVNRIAEAAREASENVLGMHFFSPANIMKLLEIVRGEQTSERALKTALAVGKAVGKTTIVAGVCHGFIANRMLEGYLREASFLIEEGALPHQIDNVMCEFGFPIGPFAMADLAGLDIGWANRKAQAATRDPSKRYAVVADRICEMGRFGQKTGRGFYRYTNGTRKGEVDEEITDLVLAASNDLGINRREISDQEIIQRCMFSPLNEGFRILQEGIADSASDIDVAWLYGYGFPRSHGGLMFYGHQIGLEKVLKAVNGYHSEHDFWQPAPLLEELAASCVSPYSFGLLR